LGIKYDDGEGVTQDHAEAVRLWRLAAEQGHAMARCILGYPWRREAACSAASLPSPTPIPRAAPPAYEPRLPQ
jgi:hypothetical protein